jgi:phage-related holin
VDGWMLAKGCVGLMVMWFSRWISSLPPMFATLMVVMALDVLSGVLRLKTKRSKKGWDWDKSLSGAKKRGGAVCVILLAGAIERHVQVKGLPEGAAMTGVAGFYVWHYGLSMLNNVVALGVPVPKVLAIVLARLSGEKPDEAPVEKAGEAA